MSSAPPTDERRCLEGFEQDLARPEIQNTSGPGAYDRLLQLLADNSGADWLRGPLSEAWAERTFSAWYSRHLLLLASWRFTALADNDHPLAAEVLWDAEADGLLERMQSAMERPELIEVLRTRSVQTNEPGRGLGWGVVAAVLGFGHRQFALYDLGTSAGLNLVLDLTSTQLRLGSSVVTGFDLPCPHLRIGLDHAPIDVADETEARWLKACVWPGQPEREKRLDECVEILRRPWPGKNSPAPELRQHTLGTDPTDAVLAEAERDEAVADVIAFESVVSDYIAPEQRERYEQTMWRWLEGGRRRVWVRLNPAPPAPGKKPMALTVHLVRGERRSIELARTGYHPSGCVFELGAIDALKAVWAS